MFAIHWCDDLEASDKGQKKSKKQFKDICSKSHKCLEEVSIHLILNILVG